jgi:Glycosyltransferase 61
MDYAPSKALERSEMYGWTDEMRAQAAMSLRQEADQAIAIFAKARAMLNDPATADIGILLGAFVHGIASHVDVEFFRLRQLTDEVGRRSGVLAAGSSFFNHDWSVPRATLERFCPDTLGLVFDVRSNQGLEATEILEWCPNECVDLSWPPNLAGFMRLPRRLPFRAYSTDDAVAYVHPLRYQVMSRDMNALWATASPRMLSRPGVSDATPMPVDRTVVIVQDRFGFSNFCHLLFDGITRILHYVAHFGYQDELFVMGGVPRRYHEMVGQALCEAARIPAESLWFPERGYLLQGARKCVWFSDQREFNTHPAQMAHPQSLAALSGVANLVEGTKETVKRLYISRGDADRRRIVNEADLIMALEGRGFVSVQLANIPPEQQVGLFRSAEVVVAPHGMGLTHIAMGKTLGRVIEIFHPEAGTDAYGFIARSAGMDYTPIFGQGVPATHSDFTIEPDRVLGALGPEGTPVRRPNWKRGANLIPASRTFHGFNGGAIDPDPKWPIFDFSPLMADQAVRFHRKAGPASNTLVGEWARVDVAPNTLYVVSCWVWLPEHIPVNEVSIRIAQWRFEQMQAAELKRNKVWQRISYTAISPPSVRQCDGGLHVVGHEGAMLASTCWQFERGVNPGAYVSTL